MQYSGRRLCFVCRLKTLSFLTAILIGAWPYAFSFASGHPAEAALWMNTKLSPDRRAKCLLSQLSIEEKIALVHAEGVGGRDLSLVSPKDYRAMRTDPGKFWLSLPKAPGSRDGDGFIRGVPRLGIPNLQMVGAGLGVTGGIAATALPAALAKTASWDVNLARLAGELIGAETLASGFNVSLGGGVNLITDPGGGRDFEYQSEDPVLAGEMEAQELLGIQRRHVIAAIKHFAFNNIETDRCIENSIVQERAMRETELLAFELAIEESSVGAVMCAYNKVNGAYACENAHLLTQILKRDWGFKGWVISDWAATHSTVAAAMAGLDDEEGTQKYFSAALERAVLQGDVPMSRLDDMVERKLRTMFAMGLFEHRAQTGKIGHKGGNRLAQQIEEEGIVLLRNSKDLLPLSDKVHTIAVIGGHADVGVLSGGGSSQVTPTGYIKFPGHTAVWDPSPPLAAIRSRAPGVQILFSNGADLSSAAHLAAAADVAIVFAVQHRMEGADAPLILPDNQNDLISRVARANRNTVVVLETGGAILMPWLHRVSAVLEAWYPGAGGGPAIARILFGDINPSGKLPVTIPRSPVDMPSPHMQVAITKSPPPASLDWFRSHCGAQLFGQVIKARREDNVFYRDGLRIGYKWYDSRGSSPQFPFGYGLSYSTFEYSDLRVSIGGVKATPRVRISFEIRNTSRRDGAEVAQIYVGLPLVAKEPPKRLIAWKRQMIVAGARKTVVLSLNPKLLSVWSVARHEWELVPGEYKIYVGRSSRDIRLRRRIWLRVSGHALLEPRTADWPNRPAMHSRAIAAFA